MRQKTDVLDTTPGTWQAVHPSRPLPRPEPNPSPGRPTGGLRDPNRSKSIQRPHRKYQSPEEMWAWHWVRMRVLLAWSFIITVCCVTTTAGVVILHEFW